MKNLFYFIAGVLFITLISATTVSIMTVKPASPKSVICFTTNYQNVSGQINSLAKKGYVVKLMLGITDRYDGRNLVSVVMEKY